LRSFHDRGEDGAIESDERVSASRAVLPATQNGARLLGERYWLTVRRASLGLVRLRETRDGSVLPLADAPRIQRRIHGAISRRFFRSLIRE
jgi:hypothetical protein